MAAKKKPAEPPDPRRVELEWLRDELKATWASATDPFARSQLAAQLRGVLNDLAALEPAKPKAGVRDELQAKRNNRAAGRRAAPAPRASAGGDRKPRSR